MESNPLESLGLYLFIGIVIGIFILIIWEWSKSKSQKRKRKPTSYQEDWQRYREIREKKKRLAKLTTNKAQETINRFKIQSFKLKKEKFSDYPKIRCISCGQIFRCHWGDDQLISHEEQESIINKKWKGFEEIS